MDRRGTAPQPAQPQPVRFWQRLPGGFWRGFISGVFALLIIGGLLGFFLSPELLKHRSSFPGEEAIGKSRVEAAIDGSYKNKANPVSATADNIASGKTIYNSNCAFCHGVSGAGDAQIGQNMFPKAANLLEHDTVEKTDGQIYWILENGLSFVGMPAFKTSLSADDMWKATLYIRQLQKGGTGATNTAAPATVAAASTTAAVTTAATATTAAAATSDPASTTAAATTAAAQTSAAAATTSAPSTTAASGNSSADLAKGLAIFKEQGCAGCHGGDKATGQIGPPLNKIAYPFSGLLRQVRSGSGVMPAFPASALSDADAMLIYNYLKSLQS